MAIKSQIDISVNSAEFAALKAAFDKYETALKKMPAAWQNVGQASLAAKTNFESVANNMKVVGGTLATITTNSKAFFEVTTATARHWHNLAISTASVAKNIVGATESLLKWSGIISLVTGGAGLFGFDRLAQSVSSQRMAAMGTGGQRGSRLAFTTNFRNVLGDPEGFLGRVAEAQTNIKESVLLRMLGLSPEDLKGDPAEAGIKALRGSARRARQDKASGLAVGSDPFLRLLAQDDRVRLRDLPEKELEERIAQMRADQKNRRFHLDPAEEKAYQDFTTRMEAASNQVETIFVKGLVKLASPLGQLSDATVKLVDKFTDKALPAFIADLAGGVEWLAKEVEKKEFVEKVEGIVAMIGSLASSFGGMLSGLGGFARWLGIASPVGGGGGGFGATPNSGGGGSTGRGFGTHGAEGEVTTGPTRDRGGTGGAAGGGTGSGHARGGESAEVVAFIRQEAIARGIDPDVAIAVARSEGLRGFDPSTGHWSTGSNDAGTSFTPFQLHYGSNIPGFRARGLGDDFTRDTGLDARRMENWKRATDYALDRAVQAHSWRDWHGFNRHPAGEGLSHAHPSRVTISATPGGNTSLSSTAAAAGSP